jgi:hypothetical protein
MTKFPDLDYYGDEERKQKPKEKTCGDAKQTETYIPDRILAGDIGVHTV